MKFCELVVEVELELVVDVELGLVMDVELELNVAKQINE